MTLVGSAGRLAVRLMKRLATAMVAVVVALGLFPVAGAAYADLTTNPHPDGTYALDDFDSAYGVPGFQKGKDYYEPVIIVKGGAGTLMVTTATYRSGATESPLPLPPWREFPTSNLQLPTSTSIPTPQPTL